MRENIYPMLLIIYSIYSIKGKQIRFDMVWSGNSIQQLFTSIWNCCKTRCWNQSVHPARRVSCYFGIFLFCKYHKSIKQADAKHIARTEIRETFQLVTIRLHGYNQQVSAAFVSLFIFIVTWCFVFIHRFVSAIQSILSCLFGFFVCLYSCRRNFLTTSHVFSESYAW